ncbi:hypothetical protein CBR_g28646 [Chara braunii]|uniref:Uncharacterized protein n=1 Tax=Chara braunii TaxID=69332 RepID=A0A388L9E3_CHABU|nr:hypothetical protein CBR_g28646 [Chara braunii]|eukprot:GBG78930.1 hypothetical protein CBR_g28646 [Chara braunii]
MDVSYRILARERNREEQKLRKQVEEAERRIEVHPISEMVWAAEREKRMAERKKLQMEKHLRWEETLKVKGIIVHDRMTTETFRKLLPSSAFHQVVQLDHPFDQSAPQPSLQKDMLNYVRLYFADILTSRRTLGSTSTDLSQVSDIWEEMTMALSTAKQLSLDRPITKEELKQTLKVMATGKCPGRDGLTLEFFWACWEALGPTLVKVYNEVLLEGKLGGWVTHGVISVLFKKGDKSNIRNYRPISILNVSYKLLAKTLAVKFGKILPKLVEKDQGAFVQGRSISINILTAIESIEIIQAEHVDLAVLLLDMEKAYDKAMAEKCGKFRVRESTKVQTWRVVEDKGTYSTLVRGEEKMDSTLEDLKEVRVLQEQAQPRGGAKAQLLHLELKDLLVEPMLYGWKDKTGSTMSINRYKLKIGVLYLQARVKKQPIVRVSEKLSRFPMEDLGNLDLFKFWAALRNLTKANQHNVDAINAPYPNCILTEVQKDEYRRSLQLVQLELEDKCLSVAGMSSGQADLGLV